MAKKSGGSSVSSKKPRQAASKPKPRTKAAYQLYPDGKIFWGMALVRNGVSPIQVDADHAVKTTDELVQVYQDLTKEKSDEG